ncbi:MAG: nucleoside hydrolase, partial [Bacteroidota bacterium]
MRYYPSFIYPVYLIVYLVFFLPTSQAQNTSRKVIFDHDGGIDDLLSLMLLTQMEDIELLGVCVTPADCFLEDATLSSLKILKLANREACPVAQGNTRPVNPFPTEWRAQPMVVNAFPQMLLTEEDPSQISTLPAHDFIASQLRKSIAPITVLITGPCTNLVKALQLHPELVDKVQEVIWMGGAVDVPGNVATHKHAGTAEWNAHWDPFASKALLGMGLDIKLISLDVTNSVPVRREFLKQLAKQAEYPLSNLASQCWATTINTIPGYEYTYFMWDVLATSYLGIPNVFTTERVELAVHTDLPNEGQTIRLPGNGQWIEVVKTVN